MKIITPNVPSICTNKEVNTHDSNVFMAGSILNNSKQSLAARFRALFVLRNLKCDESVECIAKCFSDTSALLKHELAYCLGQMQNKTAIPYLIKVLEDLNQESVVRHEAAEALGAIGSIETIDILNKYTTDCQRDVAETCILAVKRLQWLKENYDKKDNTLENSIYNSVDPTPSIEQIKDVDELSKILLNEDLSLWERYRALFALRNMCAKNNYDSKPVKIIAQGLQCNKSGALFRHEIAYVLGQIQSEAVVSELMESLRNVNENSMVRHECAEALGSIGTSECIQILQLFSNDLERIVRESCEVALDMANYEQSNEFQYAKLNN